MKYIGVIGGRICNEELAQKAYRTGWMIAESGCVLVCGGMSGIMEHACRGAIDNKGVTIGILPASDRADSNPYLTYSIPTGIGEARNSIVVKSSDGLISIGGSFGTLSEIAFALVYNKPVVGIKTWRVSDSEGNIPPIHYTDNPEEAVKIILRELK
jgi:uncharacterized protein (TIGR00725 family)